MRTANMVKMKRTVKGSAAVGLYGVEKLVNVYRIGSFVMVPNNVRAVLMKE